MVEHEPEDPRIQEIIQAENLPPEVVDQVVDEFFKIFKSSYATICIQLSERLLDEALRIGRERINSDDS